MSIRTFGMACVLATGIAMSASAALAFGPGQLLDPAASVQQDLLRASFEGRPFPYGYTGWGPCIRYVTVETRWGPRVRRIRVCR